MTLSLDGARERLLSINHAIVECVTAAWTCKYTNGYTVTLRGPLTAHVVLVQHNTRSQGTSSQPYSLKFENLEFVANFHDKSISLESIMDYRNPELSSPQTPRTKNATTPTANGSSAQTKAEDDKKWEEPRVVIDHASIPGEPVNAFGIPQATMRCLEVSICPLLPSLSSGAVMLSNNSWRRASDRWQILLHSLISLEPGL